MSSCSAQHRRGERDDVIGQTRRDVCVGGRSVYEAEDRGQHSVCGLEFTVSGPVRVIVRAMYQVLFRSFPDLLQWPDLASLGRRELLYKHLCHTRVKL